jgi:F-type H+-transporting ATPase subunit epsilon
MAESSPVLQVALVSADRTVWSGDAAMVIARTTEGDLGVLPGHEPLLSLLADSVVEIQVANTEDVIIATVDGGFISVAQNRVSVLSEHILRAEDIHVEKAKVELEEARSLLDINDEAVQRIRRAEARIRAAEKVASR